MERVYKPLQFNQIKPGTGFHQPSTYRLVEMDSPAIEVMTDLQLPPSAPMQS